MSATNIARSKMNIRKATRLGIAALRDIFSKQPTTSNLLQFNARKRINEVKKECWQNYVERHNSATKIKSVLNLIKKMAAKYQTDSVKHLPINNSK